jgi:hypothetical protein
MGKTKTPPAAGANDDDDDTEIPTATRDLIITTVNQALSAQLGRKLPTMINDAIAPAIAAVMEPITAQISQLGKSLGGGAQQGAQNGQQQGGQQGGAAGGGQANPEVAELRDSVAKLQAQLKERDERTAKAENEARTTARDSLLMTGLGKLGVDKNRMRGAAAVLKETLVQDKAGNWMYRAQRDGYTEDLALDAGLGEWAATDEGKSYLAPTQAVNGGGGTRPVRNGGNGGSKQVPKDPKAAKAERQAAGMNTLMSMVQQATDGDGVVQLTDE